MQSGRQDLHGSREGNCSGLGVFRNDKELGAAVAQESGRLLQLQSENWDRCSMHTVLGGVAYRKQRANPGSDLLSSMEEAS